MMGVVRGLKVGGYVAAWLPLFGSATSLSLEDELVASPCTNHTHHFSIITINLEASITMRSPNNEAELNA